MRPAIRPRYPPAAQSRGTTGRSFPILPFFLIALGPILIVTVYLDPFLAVALAAVFALAALLERPRVR
jgi:hypothetical protein